MSYSCEISFKHIESVNDLFSFLTEFKKGCMDCVEDVVKENIVFSPFAEWRCSREDFDNVVLPDRKEIKDRKAYDRKITETENWIKNVFTFRWTYVEKWNLLCVYSVPDQLKDMFDGKVYFQNSCDQDYDFDDWAGIKEFEEIYNSVINLSFDEIKDLYCKVNGREIFDYFLDEGDFENAQKDNFMYLRKNIVYDIIWKELESSLYDDNSVTYLTIFGSIYDTVLYPMAMKAREYMHEDYLSYEKKKED